LNLEDEDWRYAACQFNGVKSPCVQHHGKIIAFEALEFREWLRWAWFECVGSEDLKHLAAGTSCEVVRSSNAAGAYAAKYAAKPDASEDTPPCYGRAWLVWGKKNLPLASAQYVNLPDKAATRTLRTARKFAERFGKRHHYGLRNRVGVVTFFGDAAAWVRLALYNGGQVEERGKWWQSELLSGTS
jgi:hypothetical protein